jgi:hypothetical protein
VAGYNETMKMGLQYWMEWVSNILHHFLSVSCVNNYTKSIKLHLNNHDHAQGTFIDTLTFCVTFVGDKKWRGFPT